MGNGQTPVKLAPHSVEAEEAVLGSVLLDNTTYDKLAAFLTTDSFYIIRNALVWEAMTRLKNRGDVIDNLTVIDELREQEYIDDIGGGAYITYLINNTPTALHAEVYGHIVQRAYTRRRVLEAATEMAQQAIDSDREVYDVVHNAVSIVNDIASQQRRVKQQTGVNIGAVASQMLADFYDPNPSQNMLKTGIPGLDRALGGGYEVGHHQIIAASGTGKTILCGNFMLAFARQDKNIISVLMESTEELLTRRLMATHMGINPDYLKLRQVPPDPACLRCKGQPISEQLQCSCRRGEGRAKAFGEAYAEAVEWFQNLPIRIVKCRPHLNTWRHIIDTTEREWGRKADVVFMDYGQAISLPGSMNENEGHSRFANALTEMAMNDDRWLFTPLQVRKDGNAGINRPATQNDIRGTSKWYNEADTMLSLFREPLLNNSGDNVGMLDSGVMTFPKIRDTGNAYPVPVTLVTDGLFFAELEKAL